MALSQAQRSKKYREDHPARHAKAKRRWAENNPEKVAAGNKRRHKRARMKGNFKEHRHAVDRENRIRLKIQTLSHYGKNGALQCCWPGCEVNDVDVLSLDHCNDGGAEDRRARGSTGGYGFYILLRREGFPAGYQTLCHNHQWKKEIMRRRGEDIG